MADAAQSQEPDDREPTPERQAELQAAYEANVAANVAAGKEVRAPYEGVRIHTWDELRWVMQERKWSGAYKADKKERADLRGADFRLADLRGAILREADLSQANLERATLTEMNLRGANLSGADLRSSGMSVTDPCVDG